MGMPGNLYGLELVVTLQLSLPKPVIPAKATGITVYLFGRRPKAFYGRQCFSPLTLLY